MLLVLRNLQRDVGITFIYVTHDQSEALAMSDRLAVMSEGRVEQLATPTEVYDSRRPRSSPASSARPTCSSAGASPTAGERRRRHASPSPSGPRRRPSPSASGPRRSSSARRAGGCGNHFEAKVGDVLFLGHEREVLVDVGDQRLMVRSNARDYTPGEPIELGWDPADAVIVKETGTWQPLQQERLEPVTELPRRLPTGPAGF